MEKYFVLLNENPLLWGQVGLGYKVILVAWSEKPRIERDMYIPKDIKDSNGFIAELDARGLKGKVFGALSSIDLAAPTMNAINGWCDNKTMPDKFNSVLVKEEMCDAWMKAGGGNRVFMMDNEFVLFGERRAA